MCFFFYEYSASSSIFLHDLRFYLLLGTIDLLLMCFLQLLYRLIKGNPGKLSVTCVVLSRPVTIPHVVAHFLALEQQSYIRQVTSFKSPSPFILRWSTMLFNASFPSTTDGPPAAYTGRRMLFIANSSLFALDVPMMVRVRHAFHLRLYCDCSDLNFLLEYSVATSVRVFILE